MQRLTRNIVMVAASLTLTTPAFAFFFTGGEVFDPALLAQMTEKFKKATADFTTQTNKLNALKDSMKTDDAIIAQLDTLIEAGKLPKEATAKSYAALDKGTGDDKTSVTNLYNPDDKNPAASKAFGDASLTVEQYIIQGAKETYSLSGVSQAGLSQPQWRALLQALIWQESRFNPFIGSPAKAWGLTQLLVGTAQDMGVNPAYKTEPAAQVRGGGKYLAKMLAMFKGNIVNALAAYNAGPGAVQKYGGVPPFAETQNYVVVIPKKYNEYLAKIGGIDAEGTIESTLASDANYALASQTLVEYGNSSAVSIGLIAQRLKDIIQQLKTTTNPTQAWALNTYARAEMARMMALRARLAAVQTRQVSADALRQAAERAEERAFFNFQGMVQ